MKANLSDNKCQSGIAFVSLAALGVFRMAQPPGSENQGSTSKNLGNKCLVAQEEFFLACLVIIRMTPLSRF